MQQFVFIVSKFVDIPAARVVRAGQSVRRRALESMSQVDKNLREFRTGRSRFRSEIEYFLSK